MSKESFNAGQVYCDVHLVVSVVPFYCAWHSSMTYLHYLLLFGGQVSAIESDVAEAKIACLMKNTLEVIQNS